MHGKPFFFHSVEDCFRAWREYRYTRGAGLRSNTTFGLCVLPNTYWYAPAFGDGHYWLTYEVHVEVEDFLSTLGAIVDHHPVVSQHGGGGGAAKAGGGDTTHQIPRNVAEQFASCMARDGIKGWDGMGWSKKSADEEESKTRIIGSILITSRPKYVTPREQCGTEGAGTEQARKQARKQEQRR